MPAVAKVPSLPSMIDSRKFIAISLGAIVAVAIVVLTTGWLLGPVGWFLGVGFACTALVAIAALVRDRHQKYLIERGLLKRSLGS